MTQPMTTLEDVVRDFVASLSVGEQKGSSGPHTESAGDAELGLVQANSGKVPAKPVSHATHRGHRSEICR